MGKQTRPSRPAKSKGNKKTQEFSIMDCIGNKRKRTRGETIIPWYYSHQASIEHKSNIFFKENDIQNETTSQSGRSGCPARDETTSLLNDPKAIKIPSGLGHHLL
jgi:hypothetical protein